MKRARILLEIVVRHTFGVCMAGALLGALYGFLIWILAPAVNAITSPAPDFDLGQFVTTGLGLSLFGLLVALIGGFFGAMLGIAVGLVNGSLLGILTILTFYPPAEYRHYRRVTGLISAAVGVATTYFIFAYVFPVMLGTTPAEQRGITFAQSPIIIVAASGFGAWWASRSVTRWYQHKLHAQQAEEASPSSPTLL